MKTQNKQTNNLNKGLVTLCLSFIFCGAINAQDKMLLKNGEEFDVKITEVTSTEIRYKNFDNLTGPTRIVYRSEVFSIKYENGAKDVFANETKKDLSNVEMVGHPQIIIQQPAEPNKFEPDSSDFAKVKRKRFGGPRIGVTYISPGTSSDYLSSEGKQPVITQFGWQFEGRLFTVEGNTQGIIEFIPLIGGVEQGMFIPSASLLIGIRGGEKRMFEFAMGPNFSVTRDYKRDVTLQTGVVIALGTSFKHGNINFPVNLAFVPSIGSKHDIYDPSTNTSTKQSFQTGFRLSLVVGFNSRKK
ncbi:MAG: hypothetical protein Q8L81_15290 [Bacteroidota bacterium]|nr:hypothetical protein [Bacteroidota bacterium]